MAIFLHWHIHLICVVVLAYLDCNIIQLRIMLQGLCIYWY